MSKTKSVLFGLDDSDFARQALVATGDLLKNSQNLNIMVYHGACEPDFSLLSASIGEDPATLEKHRQQWGLKIRQILERARQDLAETGFDPDRTSTLLDPKCSDPSYALLQLAGQKGFETLAVARWGKATVSRQVIGSVTYRLSQMADDLALWVIDPRICSHDVLVGLVGAPISQRVVDYTVRYFSHLQASKFTFMHVIPPVPPQYWESEGIAGIEAHEKQEKMVQWIKEYTDRVKEAAAGAKQKLVDAGVPEQNIVFRLEPQKKGIARDILVELEEGNHGILVIGRKGYKAIKEFGIGSKANKLLVNGRAFVICLVN